MRFQDVPQLTRSASYQVTIPWSHLLVTLERWEQDQVKMNGKFEASPDFQRAHVWNDEKRTRYVEFILRGGKSSRDLYWNHPGWMNAWKGDMQLVDGKQRLTAATMFLQNQLPVFGGNLFENFTDKLGFDASFTFHVNDLKTRKEVLQWYLDLNDGGVAHTTEEIEHVRQLLAAEAK